MGSTSGIIANNNTSSNWRIEFVEKKLNIGVIDNLAFGGKDASHSFLRLVDEHNKVRGELHGFSYNPDNQQKADFSFNPLKKLRLIFQKKADAYVPNSLKVFHYDYDRSGHETLYPQEIMRGSKSNILEHWIKAIERGIEINAREYEYRPFNLFSWIAQNCHTASAELMDALKNAKAVKPRFAVPGFTHRLPEEERTQTGGVAVLSDLFNAMGLWSLEAKAPEKVQHNPAHYLRREDLMNHAAPNVLAA